MRTAEMNVLWPIIVEAKRRGQGVGSFHNFFEKEVRVEVESAAMTRGNQRDTDRARAQARQAKQAKSTSQGNPLLKREADAKALQEKIARKAAMKAEGGDANANSDKSGKNGKQQKKK